MKLFDFFRSKPKFSMPGYIDCAQCGKHSVVDGNGGHIKCPHCGSSRAGQLEIGTGKPPEWFKESKQ